MNTAMAKTEERLCDELGSIDEMGGEEETKEFYEALEIVKKQSALADEFSEGWDHFLKCIDFKATFLDARAITWMNEIGLKEAEIKKELS